MTKIDFLNVFAKICAATQYEYDGKTTAHLPFDLCHTDIKPILKKYAGWQSSLDHVTEFDQLPNQARAFLEDLEAMLGVPFNMISTGPEREKLLVR